MGSNGSKSQGDVIDLTQDTQGAQGTQAPQVAVVPAQPVVALLDEEGDVDIGNESDEVMRILDSDEEDEEIEIDDNTQPIPVVPLPPVPVLAAQPIPVVPLARRAPPAPQAAGPARRSLYAYQEVGVQWMLDKESVRIQGVGSGGILGDEMGLGKTFQAITVIARDTTPTHTLLFAPRNVIQQWVPYLREASINARIYGNKAWNSLSASFINRPTVWLATHQVIPRVCAGTLQRWSRFMMDEAHQVANETGKFYKTLRAKRREFMDAPMWLLTGTPVVNSMMDVVSMYYLITGTDRPADLQRGGDEEVKQITRWAFHNTLQRTVEMLRGKREYAQLPIPPVPLRETLVLQFASREERNIYMTLGTKIKDMIERVERMGDERAKTFARLTLLNWLAQLSMHPDVFIRNRLADKAQKAKEAAQGAKPQKLTLADELRQEIELDLPAPLGRPSTKMLKALELMRAERGDPRYWIMFCYFKEEVEMLKSFFDAQTELVGRVRAIYGKTKKLEIAAILETYERTRNDPRFVDASDPVPRGRSDVLIINLQSGGVGLNLQNFTRVVFLSQWWTSANMEQSIGRAVRMGQRETVKVWFLHLNYVEERLSQQISMDQRKFDRAEIKGRLLRELMKGVHLATDGDLTPTEQVKLVNSVLEIHKAAMREMGKPWLCPNCGQLNKSTQKRCPHCKTLRPGEVEEEDGGGGGAREMTAAELAARDEIEKRIEREKKAKKGKRDRPPSPTQAAPEPKRAPPPGPARQGIFGFFPQPQAPPPPPSREELQAALTRLATSSRVPYATLLNLFKNTPTDGGAIRDVMRSTQAAASARFLPASEEYASFLRELLGNFVRTNLTSDPINANAALVAFIRLKL